MKEGPRQAAHSSKLAEIAVITMGQSPPGETYNTEQTGLPFFQGKADFGEVYPTPTKWCSSPNRIAEPGDILLSVRAPVGPINIAKERCCIGRGLASIRPRSGKTITPHLRYFFLRFESEISRRGVGTTFAAINRDDIERLLVPMTSIENQRRIAEILDQADALRRKRRESLALTSSLIPSIFHSMFGDPGTNSKGWPIARLDEISSTRLGKMLDSKRQTGAHIRPYLRNVNVQWGRLDLDDLAKMDFDERDRDEFKLEVGDVLVCEGGEVGRTAIWNGEMSECYFQKALHRVRLNPARVLPEFFLSLMRVLASSGQLADLTSQATIAHLTGVKLRTLRVVVPPISAQREFAARVAEVRAFEDKQRASLLHLDSLFHSLLHRAFNRELA